ncbi:four helix bundle protein [Patescibacteria group bacterium]|nr:MAG: four helix bundle protein [Patescibacteria group bacterium]
MKIQSFRDLDVWKESHGLVILIYRSTKKFPKEEQFGLANQMRRAVVSITSNIAEGFGRSSYKDKNHFYQIAPGSIIEIQNQLIIAKDIGYISEAEFDKINNRSMKAERICRGLINKSKEFYS